MLVTNQRAPDPATLHTLRMCCGKARAGSLSYSLVSCSGAAPRTFPWPSRRSCPLLIVTSCSLRFKAMAPPPLRAFFTPYTFVIEPHILSGHLSFFSFLYSYILYRCVPERQTHAEEKGGGGGRRWRWWTLFKDLENGARQV